MRTFLRILACQLKEGSRSRPILGYALLLFLLTDTESLSQLAIDLVDRPGQLAAVATLLGEAGANIVEVSHQQTFSALPAKATLLEVVIETRDREHLDETVARMRGAGFHVEVQSNPGGRH